MFITIIDKLHSLGYGTFDLSQNISIFGVPKNCARPYIIGILGTMPQMNYKQFGNSVSVPVVEAVFNEFLKNNKHILGW